MDDTHGAAGPLRISCARDRTAPEQVDWGPGDLHSWLKWLPESVFGLGLVASVGLLVATGAGLTFNYDEWDVLLNRPGYSLNSFLAPRNGQIFLIPVAL